MAPLRAKAGRRGILRIGAGSEENIAAGGKKTGKEPTGGEQSYSASDGTYTFFVICSTPDGKCGRKQGEQLRIQRRQVGMGGYRHGRLPTISMDRRMSR